MSVSEVAKATFYRYFPSKDDLVTAYLAGRDRSFFEPFDSPAPPKDIHETLARIERVINHPDIIGCPFLRIASEYPDTDHPFHRIATEHEKRFYAYFTSLLGPFAFEIVKEQRAEDQRPTPRRAASRPRRRSRLVRHRSARGRCRW
jgi:AcrR family transcriptional regulator